MTWSVEEACGCEVLSLQHFSSFLCLNSSRKEDVGERERSNMSAAACNTSPSPLHDGSSSCRALMQQALQIHYERCQVAHTLERLTASRMAQPGPVLGELEEAAAAAHLKDAVFEPLSALNVRMRSVQAEARELESKDGSGAAFLVKWVDAIQGYERRHFTLLTNLVSLAETHLRSASLTGEQCQACISRMAEEWCAYEDLLKEAKAKERKRSLQAELERMKVVAASQGCGCGSSASGPAKSTGEDGEEKPELPPTPPLALKKRSCPHYFIHDLHSCAAYRLVMRSWQQGRPEPVDCPVRYVECFDGDARFSSDSESESNDDDDDDTRMPPILLPDGQSTLYRPGEEVEGAQREYVNYTKCRQNALACYHRSEVQKRCMLTSREVEPLQRELREVTEGINELVETLMEEAY